MIAVEDAGSGVPEELRATSSSPSDRDPACPLIPPGWASGLLWLPASPSSTEGELGWRIARGGGARFKVFLPGQQVDRNGGLGR